MGRSGNFAAEGERCGGKDFFGQGRIDVNQPEDYGRTILMLQLHLSIGSGLDVDGFGCAPGC